MKRELIVLGLFFCLVGCSKSPMDRLEAHGGKDATEMTKEDAQYWTDEANKGTKIFKGALDYCNKQIDKFNMCVTIYNINSNCEMDKTYEPDGWLTQARAVKKEHCDMQSPI